MAMTTKQILPRDWKEWPIEDQVRLLADVHASLPVEKRARGVNDYPPAVLPLTPHPRQAEFLALDCEEALYGGAAGGGKSEALLMWLAEGINNPRYSAVIFRPARSWPARTV